jgi:hypothetical protein
MAVRISFLALVAVAAACAEPLSLGELTEELGCPRLGCHENSPVIAGSPFSELNRDGLFNDLGVRIVGFRSASGVPFQLDVRQARMVGLDAAGRIALDTPGMTGAVIDLEDRAGRAIELTVIEIGSVPFWAAPAGNATSYQFGVRGGSGAGGTHALCSNPPDPVDWPGGNVLHAFTVERERYRHIEKVVSAIGPAADGWFNIACAGSAPAKMHLTRHTDAGANPARRPDRGQRQAMLKMFASAICPGSDAFTAQGEPLFYKDRLGVMAGPIDLRKVEALWGPNGAICIGEHRLEHSTVLPQMPDAEQMLLDIAVQCPNVPSCSSLPDFPNGWERYGLVISTNP